MKTIIKKTLYLSIAAAAGGLVTVGISMALQLYAFQSEFHRVFQVYQWLKTEYLTPISEEQLADGAILGMLKTLGDPYSEFIRGEESEEFSESFLGEIEGIGADIQIKDGQIFVISPIQGSPAAAAGLFPNDIIVEADGHRLDGLSLEEVARTIRGPKGTEISLLIRRVGIDGDFMLTMLRDTIPEQTVFLTELPGQLAVVRITEFSGTTYIEFEKILHELSAKEAKGVILDLRQNPGGMFSVAIDIASHFVPKGRLIAVIHYKDGSFDRFISDKTPKGFPVVVLIDEGTASSAEIVAGALKDSAGAPLVGRKTFGKGIGQRVRFFRDGSTLKYTINEAVTPSGIRFHAVGLHPDVETSLPDYAKLPIVHMSDDFRIGDFHQDIGLAQQYLAALGFDPGRTDGYFDMSTKAAVSKFQTSTKLNLSGIIDKNTSARMAEEMNNKVRDNDTQMRVAIDKLLELTG